MEANSALDESIKAEARYRIELTAKKEAAEEASRVRAFWEQEFRRLETRRTRCKILGVVIDILIIYLFAPFVLDGDFDIPTSLPTGPMLVFLAAIAIFMLLWFFTLPFGFCPVIDFMTKSSFGIIGGLFILLVLFAIVFGFAILVGPFYFFALKSKINEAKNNIELARQNEQAAYAAYQAF